MGADDEVAPDTTTVTIVFTDIVASTERSEEHGDRGWSQIVSRHDEIVRRLSATHGGEEVKGLGDGFMLVFGSATRALTFAAALAPALDDIGVLVRAGVHTGEVERHADDYRGWHVTLAARIAALGAAGDVVVSAATRDLVNPTGEWTFGPASEVSLKGIARSQIVHHLRAAGDREAADRAAGAIALRVRVLGPLAVDDLESGDLGSRKARTLLAALATAGGAPVPSDDLVELLWGDSPPARPSDQVSVLASRLRRVLGADRIVRSDAGYSVRADWIDVVELGERLAEAEARLAGGNPSTARVAATAALELVRSRLAVEEDAVWFDDRRAAVDRTIARARSLLATAALEAGDPSTAVAAASAVLDGDPYDEIALRTIMRGHVALGRSASALAAYAAFRERLIEELGADPSPETEALHTAVLVGDVGTGTPVDGSEIVGREDELAQLDAMLEQAASGRSVGIDVSGEPGIGKTALVEAFASAAAARALTIVGRCDALGRDLPMQPLLDGLERHLRSLSPDAVGDALGPDAEVIGPLVGTSLATATTVTTLRDVDDAQAVLYRSLLSVVERLAAGRPIVVIVEDVHNAGASTMEWVAHALQRGRRLLAVVTRRPDQGAPLANAQQMVLAPLGLDAAVELVGDRADELHARSGGNPLFLLELASASADEVPDSVRDLIGVRADGLGADVASTLRAAALLGSSVDLDLLAAVLGRPLDDLLDHLETGGGARIQTEAGGEMRFAHELVREALAGATTAARRAYYHREAARALDARADGDPLVIAWHARLSGDDALAARALLDAGAKALLRHDLRASGELLDESIALHDSADARIARARLHVVAWDTEAARVDAEQAIALGGGAPALEAAGWAAYYRRAHIDAQRYAEEGASRATDPGVRASCLALAGRARHSIGDLDVAGQYLEEAVDLAPPEVRGVASVWLSGLRVHQGRAMEAGDLAGRGTLGTESMPHPFAPLHGLFSLTHAHGMQGNGRDAVRVVERLESAVAAETLEGSIHRFAAVAHNLRAWLHGNLGDIARAAEHSLESCGLPVDELALAEPRYVGHLDLVEASVLDGRVDDAARDLAKIADVEQWHGSMAWHQRQRYWLLQARIALAASPGRADDHAAELAARVLDDARARGTRRYGLRAELVLAQATGVLDHDAIDTALHALESMAGLEVWWLTAELADWFDVDTWRRDAATRVARLAAASGEHGDSLRPFAQRRFPGLV